MEYPVNINGFEEHKLAVTPEGIFANPKLLIDNQLATKGQERGQFILHKKDGTTVIAQLNSAYLGFDPVPQLIIDGKIIPLMEPLERHQWIWSGIPLFLFFVGGLLGTLIGVLAFAINVRVFRSKRRSALRYLITSIVTIVSFGIYYILPVITTPLINLIFRKI